MRRFKRCPLCGASVKLENLDRHARRAHPGEQVDYDLSSSEKEAVEAKRRGRPLFSRRERLLYPLVAVVLVVAVVMGVVLTLPGGPGGTSPETASAFSLRATDGTVVRLEDFRDRVVLLDFMDPHCPHCQRETANVLVPLHRAYGDRVVFLSVAVGFVGSPDTVQDVVAFKTKYGATWTYVLDDGSVAPEYGVRGTPTTFVLRPGLTVQQTFRGETPYGDLAGALDVALGG